MSGRRRILVLLAAGGSAALLLGAFGFQYLGGLAPCKLCLWQRWPHAAAVLIGLAALRWPAMRPWPFAGALAALATSAIGFYHLGVEQRWWEGPSTCSAAAPGGLSAEALFERIMSAPLVRCDEVAWSLFGLSMAGWNALLSLGLAGLWLWAARRPG
ncbi:MAG: disulfide bond formation protein B [Roseovarius sp.]